MVPYPHVVAENREGYLRGRDIPAPHQAPMPGAPMLRGGAPTTYGCKKQ